MKIITQDAAYVQMYDMMFLHETDIPMPYSIFLKVFGQEITIVNDSNRYDFVKFEEPSEIEYFNDIDWIVDYNSVKDLSKRQIRRLIKKTKEEQKSIAENYNPLPNEEKAKKSEMVSRYDELAYKSYGLNSMLKLKQGRIEMTLPEGIEYPTDHNTTIESTIKKLIKTNNKNIV